MSLKSAIKSALSDNRGVAAVEFALIAPVLAAVIVGIAAVVPFLNANNVMHDAVSSGARYVMAGGTNATAIHDITLASWQGHTNTDTVTVSQTCTCAGATSVCTSLCADSSVPQGFTTIQTSSNYTGMMSNQTITAQQIIRTR